MSRAIFVLSIFTVLDDFHAFQNATILEHLNHRAPITTAADDIYKYLPFSLFFSDKIMLDISCESSAYSHETSNLILFSKDKSKNNKSVVCCNLLGDLRVNIAYFL